MIVVPATPKRTFRASTLGIRKDKAVATSWSFLTLEADERQFRGNAGYEDELARHYSWDQTVAFVKVSRRVLSISAASRQPRRDTGAKSSAPRVACQQSSQYNYATQSLSVCAISRAHYDVRGEVVCDEEDRG